MRANTIEVYGGVDPREIPVYTVSDVARYVSVPYHTLYSWLKPVRFDTHKGQTHRALIERPTNHWKLSFLNLVEAHVVKALRGRFKIPLTTIRASIDYAEQECRIKRPLASQELKTVGHEIFVERASQLENVGKGGQLGLRKMLSEHLERIQFDGDIAETLFPFGPVHQSRQVSISPFVAFGRPVVSEKAIRTSVITDRYNLGESEELIADDYGIRYTEVEEAILYETAA